MCQSTFAMHLCSQTAKEESAQVEVRVLQVFLKDPSTVLFCQLALAFVMLNGDTEVVTGLRRRWK